MGPPRLGAFPKKAHGNPCAHDSRAGKFVCSNVDAFAHLILGKQLFPCEEKQA
jgi:hypothetical protein